MTNERVSRRSISNRTGKRIEKTFYLFYHSKFPNRTQKTKTRTETAHRKTMIIIQLNQQNES